MIDLDDAVQIVRSHAKVLEPVTRPITHSLGFYLAQAVKAREPIPFFDSSAMDGYLVWPDDVKDASAHQPVHLKLEGEIRAGQAPLPPPQAGAALRILTGAPASEGDLAVVMKEYVDKTDSGIAVKKAAALGEHIRRRGREFKAGDTVFEQGIPVTPPVVGMLASMGFTEVELIRKPNVAIVVTGDELLPAGASGTPGQIRDANSYSLKAALQAMGIEPALVLHARDHEDEICNTLQQALDGTDVVLCAGGVSVGKYDLVKTALARIGVEQLFWGVAMKPGKPNYFGRKGNSLVFGMPGNTVSCMISFYLFARPALQRMQGRIEILQPLLKVRLKEMLEKKAGRMEWVRGRIAVDEDGVPWAQPVKGRGSHMLGNLALADCVIRFPKEEKRLDSGQWVDVMSLDWRGP